MIAEVHALPVVETFNLHAGQLHVGLFGDVLVLFFVHFHVGIVNGVLVGLVHLFFLLL